MSRALEPATHRNTHSNLQAITAAGFYGPEGEGLGRVAFGASDGGFTGFTCTAGSTFTPPTHLTSTSSFKTSQQQEKQSQLLLG